MTTLVFQLYDAKNNLFKIQVIPLRNTIKRDLPACQKYMTELLIKRSDLLMVQQLYWSN